MSTENFFNKIIENGETAKEMKVAQKVRRQEKIFNQITSQYRKYLEVEKELHMHKDMYETKEYCKRKAIEKKKTSTYDEDAFLADVRPRVELLTNAPHFQDWCKRKNLDAYNAATHVVMLGSTRLKDVLVDDVLNHGGIRLTHYPDWDKPLFTREELGLTDQLAPQQAA